MEYNLQLIYSSNVKSQRNPNSIEPIANKGIYIIFEIFGGARAYRAPQLAPPLALVHIQKENGTGLILMGVHNTMPYVPTQVAC